LSQVGKISNRRRAKRAVRRASRSWSATGGRAFACCLLAAEMHADQDSVLHIADPPFLFDQLFAAEWEEKARRRHYAAICEAAGLLGLADHVLEALPTEMPLGETFFLPSGDRERPFMFQGTYRRLYE